jgi:hypothetical protein
MAATERDTILSTAAPASTVDVPPATVNEPAVSPPPATPQPEKELLCTICGLRACWPEQADS